MWVVSPFPNGACCLWYRLLFVQLKYGSPTSNKSRVLHLITTLCLSQFHGGNCLKSFTYKAIWISPFLENVEKPGFLCSSYWAPLLLFHLPFLSSQYVGLLISSWGNRRGHLWCDVLCMAFWSSPLLRRHSLSKIGHSSRERDVSNRNTAFLYWYLVSIFTRLLTRINGSVSHSWSTG